MLLLSEIVLSVSTQVSNGRASSKDLLHYIDPTLEEQNFEVAIIHIGVNYILYDSSSRQVNLFL